MCTYTHTHTQPPPKKQKTLLPSADELFDAIDAPAFFAGGGAASAQRQAAEIAASRPTLPAPFTKQSKPGPQPGKAKVGAR